MRIALISLFFLSLGCYGQIDMALIQTGWNGEQKTYYLEGVKLQAYLDSIKKFPIIQEETQGEKFCVERIWFSSNGNFLNSSTVCSIEDLRIEPFRDDLIEIELSVNKIIGHDEAVKMYDSLKSQNIKFHVSPSINSKNKFELRAMAYFKDTLDSKKFSPSQMDSIYYYDYYRNASQKLRKAFDEIDSLDFIFSPWIKNELIVVMFLAEKEFNLKPFRKLGIHFTETPVVEERKYNFAIYNAKQE